MGKFANYLILMSGLSLLFYFAGLIELTPNSTLLNLLLDPASFQNSDISLKAILVFEIIVGSAIIVGFAAAGNIELGIMSVIIIPLINLLWDFIAVFSIVSASNPVIAVLLLSPGIFLFVVSSIEWFRGVST